MGVAGGSILGNSVVIGAGYGDPVVIEGHRIAGNGVTMGGGQVYAIIKV